MTALLSVASVSKLFPLKEPGLFGRTQGSVTALKDVSLEVYKGETVSIVGESGCGKSTLARTIALLTPPDSGGIIFEGRDMHLGSRKEKQALRRRMHLIFQDPYGSLNPRLNVGDIVAEPLTIHRIGDKVSRGHMVSEVLEEVGLQPSDINKYPHQFSGGQRQRIAIARALISKPDLIIADEPLAALDVSIQSQIINLMLELKKAHNLTYIFISHDLSVVSHVSDRVVVMYQGQIMESAPAESLFRNPHHPYTRLLLGAAPQLGRKRDRTGRVNRAAVEPASDGHFGCPFAPRCQKVQQICGLEAPSLDFQHEIRERHAAACHFPDTP